MAKLALLSVSDKQGLVEFATALVRDHGYKILSTGGTAKLLADNADGNLSPKQVAYWRRVTPSGKARIEKYVGQLLVIAQEKAAA